MVKRSRLEIYFEILRIVMRGVDKPTRIMYSANLSWNTLQGILKSLVASGFIIEKELGNAKRYDVTEKGERALSYYMSAVDGIESHLEPLKV